MRHPERLFPKILALQWVLAGCALAIAGSAPAGGAEARPAKKSEFVRLTRDQKKQPLALETAVVSHVPRDCGQTAPTVDLVAAVHIGDRKYYEELNSLFAKYDVVLYELVAPEGTKIPKGGGGAGSNHPVSVLQDAMTRVLDLEFQLRGVDYTKANLVHADLSPQQFSAAMRDRGESFWTILARVMGHAIAEQKDYTVADMRLVMALFDKNRAMALKRVLAEDFLDMEGSIQAIEGPKGSAIIADRNKAALKVLRKQIDAGRKKIAIFYGAGHMADFQDRLRDEFGLAPISTRWLVAWNLKGPASAKPAEKK
jgi:hypothetical protein